MKRYYDSLFSPLFLGKGKKVRVRNRIETAPTLCPMVDGNGYPTPAFTAYYAEKARGGAGIVTIGETAIDWDWGKTHKAQLNLWGDYAAIQMANVVDGIHKYGALANIELCHGGCYGAPELIGGKNPIGPSPYIRDDGVQILEMTKEQMEDVKENFVQAVLFCKLCGFDMTMLHGAHGWLLGAFLSPKTNWRTDEYGGSRENRMRYPLEVLQAVREAVGPDFILEFRISGSELTDGGSTIEDCIAFLEKAQEYIDLAHVSCGTRADIHGRAICQPSCFLPHACNANWAKLVKESGIKIPVVTVGAMDDPEIANGIIERGEADMVAIARGMIADPDFPKKAMYGKLEDIRPCIRCMHCLDRSVGRTNTDRVLRFSASSHRFTCAVNPAIGHQSEQLPPLTSPKKVAIIGGGPAGMVAALSLKKRGHDVTIYEKTDRLGGALTFADKVNFKIQLKLYKDYLIKQIEKNDIPVVFNINATPEMIDALDVDVVISAVGASPIVPPIEGIERGILATDSYYKDDEIGENIVVIGGGQVGCETALHFAMERGKKVTIIEMKDVIAKDASFTHRVPLVEHLDEYTTYMISTTCTKVTPDAVIVTDKDGNVKSIPADTVIIAAGMKANGDEAESFLNSAVELYVVGDCVTPATVHEAVTGAYNISLQI